MPRHIPIAACLLLFGAMPVKAVDPNVIRVGIVSSLVDEIAKAQQVFLAGEFADLAHDFTAMKTSMALGGTHLAAAKNLDAERWHLAVFPGVEFAWAQAKYPKLRPLVVATYKDANLHALLVVKKNSPAMGFDDLKGKDIALLQGKEHCRLFAHKGRAADFFGKINKTSNVEEALDNVLLGKMQAAIVDTSTIKIYEEIHPGRFGQLKVLSRSERFPAAVIAYHEGTLSDGLLKKWKDGMLRANMSEKGREVMANFRISAFAAVPADYQETLASIVKAYPAAEK